MRIDIEGLDGDSALRARIERRVGKALDRVKPAPTTALVTFTDVNGPKGGVDNRCAVTVRIPRRTRVRTIPTSGGSRGSTARRCSASPTTTRRAGAPSCPSCRSGS